MHVPTGWKEHLLLAEDSFYHPQRCDQHMNGIRQKRRLIPLDHVAYGGETKSNGNQQQTYNPVKPHDHNGREPKRNRNHVQRPIYGMRVCIVVVVEEAQRIPPASQDYSARKLFAFSSWLLAIGERQRTWFLK